MNEKSLNSIDTWLNQKIVIRRGNNSVGHSQATNKQYKSNLTRFVKFISDNYNDVFLCDSFFMENELLDAVYKYRSEYYQKGAAVTTVKTNLRAINSYYTFMFSINKIEVYPFPPNFFLEKEKGCLLVREKRVLSFCDVSSINEAIKDTQKISRIEAIIWRLSFENCLRLGEIRNIEIQRLYLDDNIIKGIILKGGKKVIDISISDELKSDIRLELASRNYNSKYLLSNSRSNMFSDQTINNMVKKIGKKIIIENLTTTLIRRTAINHKIAKDVQDILSILKFTNHESLSTTFEEYVDIEWIEKNKMY